MNSTAHTTSNATIFVDVPLWFKIPTTIYLVAITTFGVPSNIITAIVYGQTSPKTACDWLILTMGITDAVVCFFSPILYLRSFLSIVLPWTPPFICSLEFWLELSAMTASCILLVVIALDRYVKICRPDKISLTPLRARKVCLLCVIIAAVVSFFPFVLQMRNANCYIWEVSYTLATRAYFSGMFCFFVISFFTVTFAYVNICKQINEKIKIKQRLISDNGLTSPTTLQIKTERLSYRTCHILNGCFKCRDKPRKYSRDSNGDTNCVIVCCFERKGSKREEINGKYIRETDNCNNTGKIDSLLNINLEPKHFKTDEDITTNDIQELTASHFQVDKTKAGLYDTGSLQDQIEDTECLNVHQNNESETVANGKQLLHNNTLCQLHDSTELSCDVYEKQKANTGTVLKIHKTTNYSISSHETDSKDVCFNPSSDKKNKHELKTYNMPTAYSTNSIFLDRSNGTFPSQSHENKLWKDSPKISSTNPKIQLLEMDYLQKKLAADIKDNDHSLHTPTVLLFTKETDMRRNVIPTSCKCDTCQTTLHLKSNTFVFNSGSFRIQKTVSCPQIYVPEYGRYKNRFCRSKIEDGYSKQSHISNRIVNINSEVDSNHAVHVCVRHYKNKNTKIKHNTTSYKMTSSSMPSTSTSNNPCHQFWGSFTTINFQQAQNSSFYRNRDALLSRSEPCLAGNKIQSGIFSDSCHYRTHLPRTSFCKRATGVSSVSTTPHSHIEPCLLQPEVINCGRSVSFSDIVKEIPLEHLPDPDNQLSNLISAPAYTSHVDSDSVLSRSKFSHNDQQELRRNNEDVKKAATLNSSGLFPQDAIRSTENISYQESSLAGVCGTRNQTDNSSLDETGDVFADSPCATIFSRRNKQRSQFKNSKESVKSTGSRKRFARERQMTQMLFWVTFAFLLSWIPPWVIYLLCLHASMEYSRASVYPILTSINLVNYLASPVIYYRFNPTFRSRVNELMMSLVSRFYCSKKARESGMNS